MFKLFPHLPLIGLCLSASIANAAPIPPIKHEVIQFYNSPGHTAAVAKGGTKVPACGANDVCGASLKFDTKIGGVLTVTAKSPGTKAYVIEDLAPKNGGLGVVGLPKNSLDNIGKGESLSLKFDKVVELNAITFFDSQHLADFYESKNVHAQFHLDMFKNGVKTSGNYNLTNHFDPKTSFVGDTFVFTGLANDFKTSKLTEHFSFYVGGLDISAFVPPKPPTPPTPTTPPGPVDHNVPEPGTISLFALALLAFGAARRRS